MSHPRGPEPPILLGSDEAGFELKEALKAYLTATGHEVVDFGCHSLEPVDYPDVAAEVARAVASGRTDRGILVCGTGIGMAIAANKVRGVRAATVSDPYSAERARKSNNAQILCLGARVTGTELAKVLVDHWLSSEFARGGSERKVAKIDALDKGPDPERANQT